ncbi:MAG: ABC transporter permease, partial [Candidatus Omnitrophica bacterium]|nr:ABC transporter permease [Candidatus Omnitrophota bacterium]
MMFELWLSRRYLASGKREKIISLTACISMVGIALGVLVVIVVISVMSGFDKYLEDKMIGTNSHLLWEFYAGTNQPYALQEQLKQVPGVKASSPFIAGQAFIKTGVQVLGVEMRGIDPQLQPQVTKIDQYLTKGTLEVKDNEVVLGQELALNLGVGLGDTIRLISPATLKPQEFTVKGIFNSGMYLYDASLVLTDIKSAQRFFDAGDYVTGLAIKADDIYTVDAIKRSLYNKFYGEYEFEVRTWIDANRNFLQALRLEKIVMFVVVTMTVVVAAFGIISTLIMSVMSKVRDIGILRAIGARA